MYLWLFPVIFIFHDMEEIVGITDFMQRNRKSIEARFPIAKKMLAVYKNLTTEAFALAVYEEFLVIAVICILAEVTGNEFCFGIWYGAFTGFTIHLVIHLLQAVIIRKVFPGAVTSVLCLIPSIALLIRTSGHSSNFWISGCLCGIIIISSNLKLAHVIMQKRVQHYL
ncbi:Protein of unknown function with HXXEE motif-containing protein [Lachnospiraceae bacterium]|nr:Protein of unknown function with HXXEE motif-containing protein [Lachnospiraceae bacterium]